MQKYPSGSRGSPAKGVASVMVARVQISSSAPKRTGQPTCPFWRRDKPLEIVYSPRVHATSEKRKSKKYPQSRRARKPSPQGENVVFCVFGAEISRLKSCIQHEFMRRARSERIKNIRKVGERGSPRRRARMSSSAFWRRDKPLEIVYSTRVHATSEKRKNKKYPQSRRARKSSPQGENVVFCVFGAEISRLKSCILHESCRFFVKLVVLRETKRQKRRKKWKKSFILSCNITKNMVQYKISNRKRKEIEYEHLARYLKRTY